MFNNYFNSIVKELNTPIDQTLLNDASIFDYSIIAGAYNYKRHPSSPKIKENVKKYDLFSFYYVNPDKKFKIFKKYSFKKGYSTR